jgi:uncharacterized protein YchJ
MSVDYDYYGIEIINSKISKNKEKASVLFRALYKEGNSFECLISLQMFLLKTGSVFCTYMHIENRLCDTARCNLFRLLSSL